MRLKEYLPCSLTGHLWWFQGNKFENGEMTIRDHWICRCGRTKMDLWPEKDKSYLGKIKDFFNHLSRRESK